MTRPEPHLTIRAVQPVLAALRVVGADTGAILEGAGLAAVNLDDPDARVPHTAMMKFWTLAESSTGEANIGLRLAAAAPLESFEVNAYALLSSTTAREAFRRAQRYQRLVHESTVLEFREDAAGGVLRHRLPDGRSVPRQPAEFLVALWVRFGREIAGEEWLPRRVWFAHGAPGDTSEHLRLFGEAVRFSTGVTEMEVAGEVLDRVNPRASSGLAALLDRYVARQLAAAPSAATVSESVRTKVRASLRDGAPAAAEIASALRISIRTLHRSLREEGTTYGALVDQLRREEAVRLLGNPHCSISEVAFLLGFAELSSFYRAFRRWTGTTPAEYRAAGR